MMFWVSSSWTQQNSDRFARTRKKKREKKGKRKKKKENPSIKKQD